MVRSPVPIVVLLLPIVLFAGASLVAAQAIERDAPSPGTGVHRDTIRVHGPGPYALRPFVIPGSETVIGPDGPWLRSAYSIDHRSGRLRVRRADTARTVRVRYRTFPFARTDTAAGSKRQNEGRDARTRPVGTSRTPPDGSEGGDAEGGSGSRGSSGPMPSLVRSGSIARGVVAGNRRDPAVESGMRLRLAGPLTEEVDVEAVLSDQQTPLQPDGTTRRLSDLDQVFMRMSTPYGAATLGDFEFEMGEETFARFDRKLQGASFVSERDSSAEGAWFGGRVAGAVTRGLYRRQQIEAIDGVQGPYQLRGEHGEPFILVIAGSEDVYLDGELLRRGRGYTIDYETGELSFAADRLITADRRIVVEYQYRTHRFTRTLTAGEGTASFPLGGSDRRLEIGARVIREADSPLFARELGLTRADSAALRAAGDGPATRPGAERVAFREESPYVPYVRRDTVWAGRPVRVFAPAEARRDSVYRVRFTRTGSDSASYRRIGHALNGITYEWVGPGRGTYEPLEVVPRPAETQLLDVTGSYRPADGVEVFGEFARSAFDPNRLSARGDGDDEAGALRWGVRLDEVLLGGGAFGRLSGAVRHRRMGADFEAFDRIRPVEFDRRWNLTGPVSATGPSVEGASERATEASLGWSWSDHLSLRGAWGSMRLGERFEGRRREVRVEVPNAGPFRGRYRAEWIRSTDRRRDRAGDWLRQRGRIAGEGPGGSLRPFLELEHERRRMHGVGSDSLVRPSEAFVEVRPGLAWSAGDLEVEHRFEHRRARRPDGTGLAQGPRSWTARTALSYRPRPRLRGRGSFVYRYRRVPAGTPDADRLRAGPTVAVRLDGTWRSASRSLGLEGTYEGATERTPILQETYVRTGPELGTYVWEDADGDGLTQLDEFLPEPTPLEGNYVRRYFPSDELVPVVRGRARLRVHVDGRRLFPDPQGWWESAIARTASETRAEVEEESTTDVLSDVYLLRIGTFQDRDRTVDGRFRLSERLELFPGRSSFGVILRGDYVSGLHRRSAGVEDRLHRTAELEAYSRSGSGWAGRLIAGLAEDRSSNGRFESRTFDVRSRSLEPELTVPLGPGWEGRLGLRWSSKRDPSGAPPPRTARVLTVPVRVDFAGTGDWQLRGRFAPAWVRLDGRARGLAGYELTEGRGPGRSLRWHLRGRYRLSERLEASLSYDGRLPADAPAVHTVRMELRATF